MKQLLLYLFLIIFCSCLKDDIEIIDTHSEEQLERRDLIDRDKDAPCPLNITQIGIDENGCCIYQITFSPSLNKGTYRLENNGQMVYSPVFIDGSYKWTVRTCSSTIVCLYLQGKRGGQGRAICCEVIRCGVDYEDCDLDVSVTEIGINGPNGCQLRICVDCDDSTKSNDCGSALLINGVNQGVAFKNCWIVTVPSNETINIQVLNNNKEICYEEEYTCDYDCCQDLDYDICLVNVETDCIEINLTLTSESCAGRSTLSSVGYKNGTARVINHSTGSIEVCITDETDNYNVGVSASIETENCGVFTTGFIYPYRDYKDGILSSCFE